MTMTKWQHAHADTCVHLRIPAGSINSCEMWRLRARDSAEWATVQCNACALVK